MLGLRASESSLLTFAYESLSDDARAALRAEGQYDSTVKLRMSSVQVSYWHPAVMRTVEYLQGGVLGAIVSAASSTVVQAARSVLNAEASAMALHLSLIHI